MDSDITYSSLLCQSADSNNSIDAGLSYEQDYNALTALLRSGENLEMLRRMPHDVLALPKLFNVATVADIPRHAIREAALSVLADQDSTSLPARPSSNFASG